MVLEMELKLARVADEFTSDLQIAKDIAGPLFLSRETATMFILTVHLRGYEKRNIKIEINEDGTRILISGEKEVQETLMVGWRLHKKEKEIRGFRKAFKIPDGVILDRIRAKFDEDESILTISMPKKEKGIRGFSVEEVTEHELGRGGSATLKIDDHEKITSQQIDQENEAGGIKSSQVSEIVNGKEAQEDVFPEETQRQIIRDLKEQTEIEKQEGYDASLRKVEEPSVESNVKAPIDESKDGLEKDGISQGVGEKMQEEQRTDEDRGKENYIKANYKEEEEEEGESDQVQGPEVAAREEAMEERGKFKICTPIVAGSALLLSIVVFVIHFIRTKSQPGKRKD